MINYHCPGFWTHFEVFQLLFDLYDNHRECFYEDVQISCIFGAFPGMDWNGGSYFPGKADMQEIINKAQYFSQRKTPLKFTLTNPLLNELDCFNRYCNTILAMCDNGINEVLVSSPIIEEHIRENFPNYKINLSIIETTNTDRTVEEYVDLTKKYNHIVLPRKFNNDFKFLNAIPLEYRNKFEILCTDPCNPNCSRLGSHYYDYAKAQLGLTADNSLLKCSSLDAKEPFRLNKNKEHQIEYDDIKNIYEPIGFSEFKISGRANSAGIIDMVYRLIKPEYHKDLFLLIFR